MLKDWLEKIERFGFAFVEGTPATPEATQAVARRAAYIRETIFGGYYDFTANMEHKDTAYTSMAIGPHTDGTYSFDAPGYQMFHCLGLDCVGGDSVLVDGFEIAAIMKREMPDLYRVLTEVEVTGQYLDHEKGIHLTGQAAGLPARFIGSRWCRSASTISTARRCSCRSSSCRSSTAPMAPSRGSPMTASCNTAAGWSRARWCCSTTGACCMRATPIRAIGVSPAPISTRRMSRAACGSLRLREKELAAAA